MPLYRLGEHAPQIDPTAWVADDAVLVGRVVLGPGASVWFGAVLRADNEPITIGARCNIQAVVLNGAVIGAECLVGACALITENKRFPAGSLIVGSPAVVKRAMDAAQIAGLADSADGYVERAARYRATLVRVG